MKRILLLMLVCIIGKQGYPQPVNNGNSIILKIVTDSLDITDTVRVFYKNNLWGSALRVKPIQISGFDEENIFRIPLEPAAKGAYVSITGIRNIPQGNAVSYFFAEAGDSVVCNYYKGNWYFDGSGYEKFQCQRDIMNAGKFAPLDRKRRNGIYSEQAVHDFKISLKTISLNTQMGLGILEWYKDLLTGFSYNIIKANILGKSEEASAGMYRRQILQVNENCKDTLLRHILLNRIDSVYSAKKVFDFSEFPDTVLACSDGFLNFKTTSRNDAAYIHLRDHYKGFLRDRLLTAFFVRNITLMPESSTWLETALPLISDKNCRDILLPLAAAVTTGKPAFDFALPDMHNQTVRLGDFKDKVVLLDFWYTGCGSCKILAQNMKPVVGHFKDNPKVAFVSISIDEDFEEWKRSVRSGTYTNEGSIDLYTDSQKAEHPVIRHYNITGYPTLMLVSREGKIITASPPRPSGTDAGKAQELIDLIEASL